ncbi:MAG: hypothetical protein V1736_10945 [Pseudomonadota bacterium]
MKTVDSSQKIDWILIPTLLVAFLFLPAGLNIAQCQAATEKTIRDAILEKTEIVLYTMDLNQDGKVDVADIVYLKGNPPKFGIPTGEHVGTMYRDHGDLIAGMRSNFGQIPFVLRVTSDSPLEGKIDNSQDNNSLYFPEGESAMSFTDDPSLNLTSSVTFATVAPNLAPDGTLTRTVTFWGSFDDPEHRLMSGFYEERILGFKDNRGIDIPIILTGRFTLIFNRI